MKEYINYEFLFKEGIPVATDLAPWQFCNLDSDFMWPDFSKSIRYKTNSLGYRDIEWSDSDLDSAVWCLGNSDVFGIGLESENIWTNLLSKKTINLGVAASGYDTFARIIVCGLKKYKPKGIIIQDAYFKIYEFVTEKVKQSVIDLDIPWLLPYDDLFKYYDDISQQYNTEKNIELIKLTCDKQNVPCFIFSLDREKELKKDIAIDNFHLGKKIHHDIACFLNKNVNFLRD
jgi:hypothetical protein